MDTIEKHPEQPTTASEERVVERKEVTKPGRGIRVVRLQVSSSQVSSVTAALQYGRSLRIKPST